MALDRDVTETINNIVAEWIADGRMFTAFEVSLEAKERGADERHRNMKDAIHQALSRFGSTRGYTRTLMDVGANNEAWVYHEGDADPSDYRPLSRGNDSRGGNANRTSVSSHRPSAASSATSNDAADSSGRLKISADKLSQIGIGCEDEAIVKCDDINAEIRITRPTLFDDSPPDAHYQTDKQGDLHLPSSVMQRAGLGHASSFDVTAASGRITVRER